MFRKLLVATDFSQCSEQLWKCLDEFRELGTQDVVLMHAVPLTVGRSVELAEEQLEERKKEIEKYGLNTIVRVQVGHEAQEINDVAVKEKVDLVLVGAKGENRIREAFIGNTVRDLIRIGKVPILIEKLKFVKGQCTSVTPRKFAKVLLPIDFSEASMQVFSLVKEKMAGYIKELILVNVVDSGHTEDMINEQRNQALDRLQDLRQYMQDAGINTEVRVRIGIPSQHIVSLCREDMVTLVILATRGAGSIKELLLGSTAENVVRKCPRSVLLFRNKEKYPYTC